LLGCEGLKGLSEGLMQLSSLRDLSLKLEDVHLGNGGMLAIGSALGSMERLRLLVVNMENCQSEDYPIGDEGFQGFAKGLGQCRRLKTLLFDCSGSGGKDLPEFGDNIGALTELTQVCFNFGQCAPLSDAGLRSIGVGISKLAHLQGLVMNLEDCSSIGGSNGLQCLGAGIGQLKQLHKLHMNFGSCGGITDDDMGGLGSGLGSCHALSDLVLSFEKGKFGNAGLRGFGIGLGSLLHLVNLDIDLSSCHEVGDAGVQALSSGIGRLHCLENLGLRFFGCGFGNEALGALGEGIGRLTNLRDLRVECYGLFRIGDAGLCRFGAGIQRLRELTQLALIFYRCSITSKGLSRLGRGLASLLKLASLNLDFRYCGQIQDDGLNTDFSRGLGCLRSLRCLKAAFGGCANITDAGLEGLGQALSNLTFLEVAHLDFGDCFDINDGGMLQVVRGLQAGVTEVKLCFLFTGVSPEDQWIVSAEHLQRLRKRRAPLQTCLLRKASSILHDTTVDFEGYTDLQSDELRTRRARVPDPIAEESLVSRGILSGKPEDEEGLPDHVPNLYSFSEDGLFSLRCTERNRAYLKMPDDSTARCSQLEKEKTVKHASLDLALDSMWKFEARLVRRVTERWGIKFVGVALVRHPAGGLHVVYIPGVLTFDAAGITGDPHCSERIGPACCRAQVSITLAQLKMLQHGGTREDLDELDAATRELSLCFAGRIALKKWMRHQLEATCLDMVQAKPYPAFLQELVAGGALVILAESRRVTVEYLQSFETGQPVVPEAYLKKVGAKDRSCFGRSCFYGLPTSALQENRSMFEDACATPTAKQEFTLGRNSPLLAWLGKCACCAY